MVGAVTGFPVQYVSGGYLIAGFIHVDPNEAAREVFGIAIGHPEEGKLVGILLGATAWRYATDRSLAWRAWARTSSR